MFGVNSEHKRNGHMFSKTLDWLKRNKLKFSIILALIVIAYVSLPFLGYDNPLEQSVEWVIKTWTGAEIELTPEVITDRIPLQDDSLPLD